MTNLPFIQQDVNLKPLNTFGIPARAKYFAAIHAADELITLLSHTDYKHLPRILLGGGSNVLFTKDFPGLLLKNDICGIEHLAEDEHSVLLRVGAGENWHALVMYCVNRGYGGIENLSLIPGTVGAAPIQNIGAYGVEIKETLVKVEVFDIPTLEYKELSNADCEFRYRDSVFKQTHKDRYIILYVVLRLTKNPTYRTEYGAIRETLQKMQVKALSLKAISDAVVHIRQQKLPDPKILGNAGSFFKNPMISAKQFQELQKRFPSISHFPTEKENYIKISAAWLIEQCGFKGKRFGNVGVYEKQALILVNFGGGSGAEVIALAKEIQAAVQREFEIELHLEVNLI